MSEPLTDAERIDRLEQQVFELKKALGLVFVGVAPALKYLDAVWDKEKEKP